MDYKKIIKSRAVRIQILKLLSWVPDKWLVSIQYKIKTGRWPKLKKPERFTEKLQWYKLYYRDPVMSRCVDKAEVREYVESIGLKDILNKCYGVYDSVDEIDFDNLPNSFVLKDTLGGGGNSVIIVKDKRSADLEGIKKEMRKWLESNNRKPKKHVAREWVYDGKKSRIIIEELLKPEDEERGIKDIKICCFGGKVGFLYFVTDRKLGNGASFAFLDKDFNFLNVLRSDERGPNKIPSKPENFEELKRIAEKLSERFPHVRVDLYNEFGNIRFGELTFFDGSGYMTFTPDSADFKFGSYFKMKNQ